MPCMCQEQERPKPDEEHDLLTSPLGFVVLRIVSEAVKAVRTTKRQHSYRLAPWLPV